MIGKGYDEKLGPVVRWLTSEVEGGQEHTPSWEYYFGETRLGSGDGIKRPEGIHATAFRRGFTLPSFLGGRVCLLASFAVLTGVGSGFDRTGHLFDFRLPFHADVGM